MITDILIYRYKTMFEGDMECKGAGKVLYKGSATTDLDPGSYLADVDKAAKRYVVDRPKPKSRNAYRFVLDFEGTEDPFKLAYAPRFRLSIEGSGPKDDPNKEMLYGIGPDAYGDDADYIDNVTAGSYDIPNDEFSVQHRDGSSITLDLAEILAGMAQGGSGATMYTYYRDLRTKKIMPNIWDARSAPNIAAMAQETEKARDDSIIFQQAMDAAILILSFVQLSLGAMKAMGASKPGAGGGGSRGWRLNRPSSTQLARGMVKRLREAGRRIVVNIGGEGEEAGAINVNNKTRLNTPIENFVQEDAGRIGELFEPNSVDEIISNRLPPNTLNWSRTIPGAHRILKPGGRIVIRFQGRGMDGDTIVPQLRRLGFREINDWGGGGAIFEAIK